MPISSLAIRFKKPPQRDGVGGTKPDTNGKNTVPLAVRPSSPGRLLADAHGIKMVLPGMSHGHRERETASL